MLIQNKAFFLIVATEPFPSLQFNFCELSKYQMQTGIVLGEAGWP